MNSRNFLFWIFALVQGIVIYILATYLIFSQEASLTFGREVMFRIYPALLSVSILGIESLIYYQTRKE